MESKNLRKLLDEYEEIDIIEMLKNFKSIRTSGIKNDIEVFLQEKAIKFEKSSISSTYIVFSKKNEIEVWLFQKKILRFYLKLSRKN